MESGSAFEKKLQCESYCQCALCKIRSLWIILVLPLRHLTVPSVLSVKHTYHICLDVLLHQLAAINTSPLRTCVFRSGIWVELSEVCCCSIRINAGILKHSTGGFCVLKEFICLLCFVLQHRGFSAWFTKSHHSKHSIITGPIRHR